MSICTKGDLQLMGVWGFFFFLKRRCARMCCCCSHLTAAGSISATSSGATEAKPVGHLDVPGHFAPLSTGAAGERGHGPEDKGHLFM